MVLYAITDHPQAPMPAEAGLEDAALCTVSYRDLAALVSPLPTEGPILPTEANLWRHEAVVEALMADRTVLPVRFGTVLPDEAALYAVLTAHYADFVARLDRVRGRVELGLRVLWEEDQQPTTDAPRRTPHDEGRVYLLARWEEERARQAERHRAEELALALHAPLARLASESTYQVLITPRLLLTAAYLVAGDEVTAFREAVEALSVATPRLRFLCTGPWPPYSFVQPDPQGFPKP